MTAGNVTAWFETRLSTFLKTILNKFTMKLLLLLDIKSAFLYFINLHLLLNSGLDPESGVLLTWMFMDEFLQN